MTEDVQGSAAAHPRRDPRSLAGLLPRVAAARCTCSGSRPARSARTRSSVAACPMGAGQRVGAAPRGHRATSPISYFGDGAVNIGSVLETMNLAAAWKLPFGFFIENNLYAVSTEVSRGDRRGAAVRPRARFRHPGLAGRRHGDPLAVHLAMEEAGRADARRRGAPPSSRRRSTASSTRTAPTRAARSATGRRTRRLDWRGRDPLVRCGGPSSLALGVLSPRAGLGRFRKPGAQAAMKGTSRAGSTRPTRSRRASGASGPSSGRTRRSSMWASGGTLSEFRWRSSRAARLRGREVTRRFVDAVAGVMHRRMAGRADRRAGRGRAPAQRRNQRRDQGTGRTSRTGCSARRSARTRSRASAAGWPSTAASARSSS